MDNDKCWAEFKITDKSNGLSVEEIQRAALTLFSTPIRLPQDRPKLMTLEEFIIGDRNEMQDKE